LFLFAFPEKSSKFWGSEKGFENYKLFQGLKSSTKGNNSLKKGALFLIIISL
jgi:hypothetical protein